MKRIKSFLFAVAICGLGMQPCLADEPSLNPSEASVVSVALVLSLPLFALSNSVDFSQTFSESKKAQEVRPKAGALPAMEVVGLRTLADGGREVDLKVAEGVHAGATANLIWPQSKDDPARKFREGETVQFKPSARGSGWMVRNAADDALAFVPVTSAARQQHSEIWH